jgi:Asp-tRNA(Asn)/Glu-tRNA(Gln) amidotransferase A subunit family amidase
MPELSDLSAVRFRSLLERRECSAEEVLKSCLQKIRSQDPIIRAFVDIDEQGAIEQARACDRAPPNGPLHGIPIAVKDTVDVAGLRCTWGSPVHADRVPRTDAAVVRRLRDAGAVIVGTTVTTEYAIAKAVPTTNPHNPAFTPGGSSSGSGAAVAARMVPLAVATQSVGSIIRPAIFCGVFGLKPTFGAISTIGAMPLSARLDHIGPMARTVEDIALACQVMFAREPGDSLAVQVRPSKLRSPATDTRVLRVDGPLADRIEPPTAAALDRAQRVLEGAGLSVTAVDLPDHFSRLINCYETIIFRDLAQRHGADRDQHGDKLSDRFKEIIEIGRATTAAAYDAAVADATSYRHHIVELLDGETVILAPATDGLAPRMSDRTGEQKLQSLWTVTGVPSLATPCGKVDGLPVGVQLVAAPGREDLALAAAQLIELKYGRESLV